MEDSKPAWKTQLTRWFAEGEPYWPVRKRPIYKSLYDCIRYFIDENRRHPSYPRIRGMTFSSLPQRFEDEVLGNGSVEQGGK